MCLRSSEDRPVVPAAVEAALDLVLALGVGLADVEGVDADPMRRQRVPEVAG
jgi:hypothetical protein